MLGLGVVRNQLQSVLDGRERGTNVLELKVALDQIGQAVRSVVPESMWAAIVEKLEELEPHLGGARRRHGLLR